MSAIYAGRPPGLSRPLTPASVRARIIWRVATRVAAPARLDPLGAGAPAEAIDWTTAIDRRRRYYCETLSPLFYTPSYARLAEPVRRRYTQLMGMLSNELIARLEADIVDPCLAAVERLRDLPPELRAAIGGFRADERRHAEAWHRLNVLSEPTWYGGGRRAALLGVPPIVGRLAPGLAGQRWAVPAVLWIQLLQEERSIDISRRLLRLPADTIEPRYAAVYREHLRDEARHVQLDARLIAHVRARQSPAARRATMAVVRWVVRRFFLAPARSADRLTRILGAEFPDIRPLVPVITGELHAVAGDDRYHAMMYSRATTPISFRLFDAYPECHAMQTVLRAYRPEPQERPA
jgi:hypothetical protein